LQTFSTTLAMKSKIEHRGTILVKDLIKKNMSFQNVWHKGFSDVKKTSLHSVMEGFQSRISSIFFCKNLFIFITHFWKLQPMQSYLSFFRPTNVGKLYEKL
jgi:hypothetical protein